MELTLLPSILAPSNAVAPGDTRPAKAEEDSKARAVATDYESFFISMYLETMFSGVETEGVFGGGQAEIGRQNSREVGLDKARIHIPYCFAVSAAAADERAERRFIEDNHGSFAANGDGGTAHLAGGEKFQRAAPGEGICRQRHHIERQLSGARHLGALGPVIITL